MKRYESKRIFFVFSLLLFLLLFNTTIKSDANNDHTKVGIDEKLGSFIPLDLNFRDENGNPVKLNQLLKRPVVLALVYYHCPGICSPLLSGVAEVVDRVDLNPGQDFDVWTISFDPKDTPAEARKWKTEHSNFMKRQIPASAWTYMTGDSVSIHKLTDAVGFYFKSDGKNDFLHMGSLIVISPKGKIIRYIFGTQFLPFDLKMAVLEAEKGTPTPTINKILAFCYSYDPQGGKYVFNITKVVGSLMLFAVALFFAVLTIKNRMKKSVERS